MELTCLHCDRESLLPYELERACLSCGYIFAKREKELCKIQQKIDRLKYAEKKIKCICIDIYRKYEEDDFKGFSNVISR